MKNYLVAATKRSGHHAIIRWFSEQALETVVHHNDVNIDSLAKGSLIYCGGNTSRTYPGNNDLVSIFSSEDKNLLDVKNTSIKSPLFEISPKIIIVLRDIRNTIASILKSTAPHELKNRLSCLIPVWRQFATNFIDDHKESYILYDKWFSNRSYRRSICNKLNIPFTDACLNIVSDFGCYSSFDGRKYQENAQKMDVLNRWKNYKNNELFNSIITNNLIELNNKIFGV